MAQQVTYALTKQTLGLYWQYIKRYPRFVWPLLTVEVVTILLVGFLQPFIVSQVLDRLSRHAYDTHHVWASFAPELIIFASSAVLADIIGWRTVMWLVGTLELKVARDLTQRIYA